FHTEALFDVGDKIFQLCRLCPTEIVNFISFNVLFDNRPDAVKNVIDMSEVSLHLSVIENMDLFVRKNVLHEFEESHIRASIFPVHRKEAQADHVYVIEMMI